MDADNVVSMVDDFNLAATVSQIKEFERFLADEKLIPRWKYIIVDNLSGKYIRRGSVANYLIHISNEFIDDMKTGEIQLYDLETANDLCEALNGGADLGTEQKFQFTPVGWRRYCIIHLAALYSVVQQMDSHGKTKRLFAAS